MLWIPCLLYIFVIYLQNNIFTIVSRNIKDVTEYY